jgi:formylglycine-generating enzyme required for sulfatase activity
LVDAETIKVSDFGIVKVEHGADTMTSKLTPGTSAYMSPEAILGPQRFGLKQLDARSDVYALGITLYEMLAGRLPFSPAQGVNPDLALRRMQVEEMPPPPSTFYPPIPPELDRLVLRALEKNPEHRYQTALEFKQAILEFSGERAPTVISEVIVPFAEQSPPPSTPHPGAAATPRPALSPAAAAASATPLPVNPAATSPAVLMPDPAAARQAIRERPRSSRMIYWLFAAALTLAALALAIVFIQQRRAAPVTKAESTPVPQPSASPTPMPPEPAGMVLIPGGSFMMGRNLSEAERRIEIFSFDYPAHEVKVAAFYLDLTEVSNREYAGFVQAAGRAAPKGWNGIKPPEGAEDLPVVHISYQDAVEYCTWRTAQRRDGLSYRLPTEEEWEFAARGAGAGQPGQQLRLFPWGSEWRSGLANTKESRLSHPQIVAANRAGASPFGALNLSGNVAEWTATDFNHYPGSDRPTPRAKGYAGTYQVVRGGSFDYPKEWAMTTTRAWAKPTDKGPSIGFRCAADARR